MTLEAVPIWCFDDDPEPTRYPSIPEAEADIESFLVREGIIEALYTEDGRIVHARPEGHFVRLEVTEERDLEDLRRRLGRDP